MFLIRFTEEFELLDTKSVIALIINFKENFIDLNNPVVVWTSACGCCLLFDYPKVDLGYNQVTASFTKRT